MPLIHKQYKYLLLFRDYMKFLDCFKQLPVNFTLAGVRLLSEVEIALKHKIIL